MTEFFKKTMGIVTVTLVISAIFSLSATVFAQLQYTPLAPLPGTTVGTNCNTSDPVNDPNCKVGVSSYIPAIFKLSIAIAGILAVLMMVVGGVQYLSTDAISGKEEGKEKIQNALWGFLLAIGAFIILNTINPGLLSFDLGKYQSIKQAPSAPAPTPSRAGVLAFCTAENSIPGRTWCDDSIERNKLAAGLNPVAVKQNGPCLDIGQQDCTSVFGLYDATINAIKGVKIRCDAFAAKNNLPECKIVITGGTEYWLHGKTKGGKPTPPECVLDIKCNPTGHKPNGTVVDFRMGDPSFDSYIKQNGPASAFSCAPGTKYIVNGKIYVDEAPGGDHWHVCY